MRTLLSRTFLLVPLAVLGACADFVEPPPPEAASPRATATAAAAVTREQQALDELSRAVALALRDQGLRQRLKNDLRHSPFPEHKVELRSYLASGEGGILLAKMATETGRTREELLALVASVRPLEMYLPVRVHRARWTGGPDLIVANMLDDETVASFFDLDGQRLHLSLDALPREAVLSLVPVETDFSQPIPEARRKNLEDRRGNETTVGTYALEMMAYCEPVDSPIDGEPYLMAISDPCYDDGGGGGGGWDDTDPDYSPPSVPAPVIPGIYFDAMRIYSDHEPWLTKGKPELEVYFSGTIRGLYKDIAPPGSGTIALAYSPNELRTLDMDCAGEKASGIRYFNFNEEKLYTERRLIAETDRFRYTEQVKAVNGPVVLLERRVPSEPPFQITIWERDDFKACPSGRRTFEVAFTVEFSWVAGSVPFPSVSSFDGNDIMALLGYNNDLVARWTISSFDQLEAFNYTWLYGSDASLQVTNVGFSRYHIPPYEETRYW